MTECTQTVFAFPSCKSRKVSADFAGKKDPASLVIERPPVAGQVPVEGPGRKRFNEMLKLISESDGGITPDWSGAPDLDKHSWWFMK